MSVLDMSCALAWCLLLGPLALVHALPGEPTAPTPLVTLAPSEGWNPKPTGIPQPELLKRVVPTSRVCGWLDGDQCECNPFVNKLLPRHRHRNGGERRD